MADNLDLGSVYFKIDADTGKVNVASQAMDDMGKSADNAKGKVDKFDSSTTKVNTTVGKLGSQTKETDKQVSSFAKSAAAAAVALASMVSAGAGLSKLVETGRSMGVVNASLITATGSAAKASMAFDDLVNLAARLPNSLNDTISAFIKLKNLGLDPSEAAIVSYTNTASAMGKSLDQMIEAVADASTAEFERLKEFGIRASNQGDEIEFTFRGVTTTVKNSAEEIQGYLLGLGNVEFAGAAAERMKTLDGAISNLGDTWDGLFRTIYDSDVGDAIESTVSTANDALSALDDIIKNNGDTIKVTATALATATGAYAAYRLMLMKTIVQQGIFNALAKANPIGIAITAAGAAFGVANGFLSQYKSETEQAATKTRELARDIDDLTESQRRNNEQELSKKLIEQQEKLVALKKEQADEQARLEAELGKGSQYGLVGTGTSAKSLTISNTISETEKFIKEIKKGIKDLSAAGTVINITSGADADALEQAAKEAAQLEKLSRAYGEYSDLRIQGQKEYDASMNSILTTYDAEHIALTKLYNDRDFINNALKTASSQDAPALERALEKVNKQIDDMQSIGAIDWEGIGASVAGSITSAVISGDWDAAGASIGQTLGSSLGTAIGGPIGGAIGGAIGEALLSAPEIETDYLANQAAQGTGTVLGDLNAQSESIRGALEDNTDSVMDLVGANKNLIYALSDLVDGIGGASALISRDIEFNGIGQLTSGNAISDAYENIMDTVFNSSIFGNTGIDKIFGSLGGKILGNVFGGSSTVNDEGVKIIGGTLQDILTSTTAQAFQEIKIDGGWFSSDKTKNYTKNVSGAVESQFDLVFQDIFAAVGEGAEMLGLSNIDISKELNSFVVSSFNISLKDMSASEQTAAIEAVFSKVFDNLANSVIPFLDDFQKAGESAGETMARLATSLEVTRYALGALSQSLDNLGTVEAVSLSQYLIDAAGSMSELASEVDSFVSNFYDDDERVALLSSRLNSELKEMGMYLPQSADGFKELVQGIDATTEAGAGQLAILLDLQDSAAEYYDILEQTGVALEMITALSDVESAWNDFSDQVLSMRESLYALIGDEELLQYQREQELAAMDPMLRASQKRIWALQDEQEAIKENAESLAEVTDFLSGAFDDIANYRLGILGGDEALATSSYFDQLDLAMGGDRDAISNITDYAQSYLDAQMASASSLEEYNKAVRLVAADLSGVEESTTPEEFLAEEIRKALEDTIGTEASEDLDSISNDAKSQLDLLDLNNDKMSDMVVGLDILGDTIFSLDESIRLLYNLQAQDYANIERSAELKEIISNYESNISSVQGKIEDIYDQPAPSAPTTSAPSKATSANPTYSKYLDAYVPNTSSFNSYYGGKNGYGYGFDEMMRFIDEEYTDQFAIDKAQYKKDLKEYNESISEQVAPLNTAISDLQAELQPLLDELTDLQALGYSQGGYTGPGGINEVAGVVHKGEYVLSQDMLSTLGGVSAVSKLDKLKDGYAQGGLVGMAPNMMTGQADVSAMYMRDMSSQMRAMNSELKTLRENQYRIGMQNLVNTGKTKDVLKSWDIIGMPPERT